MRHIGFILGKDDPYTVIDLDDPFERNIKGVKSVITPTCPDYPEAVERAARHDEIYETFQTYAELSQSGRGVHLVMRGTIPQGVRRDKVEIYSDSRYIIFTGHVLRAAPIVDCQPLLTNMFSQMGKMTTQTGDLIEEEPTREDSEIWRMASNAVNADKFIDLCEGNWSKYPIYPSQSEADYALLSMLCFYSRSNEQVRRMFRQTELGKRKKAQRDDYLNRALRAIRAKEPPKVDVSPILKASTSSSSVLKEEGSEAPPPLQGGILSPAIHTDKSLAALKIPTRQSLLGDWFKSADYGVIYGRRGLGKSWLALGIARALAEGRSLGPWIVATPRRVLYVDGEMSLDDFRKRQQLLMEKNGMMLSLSHQAVFDESEKALCLSDAEQQHELTLYCQKHQVDVLFLDNGACLFRGVAENDADDFRDKIEGWILDLRRRGIAVVLVMHAGRNGHIRGTSKREDAAFWILRLDEANGGEPSDGAMFITRFVKNRNAEQDPPSLNWHFQTNGDQMEVTVKEASLLAIFRQWIEDGLDTCSEIAQEMGYTPGTISKLAKRGQQEGWLEVKGRKYVVTRK